MGTVAGTRAGLVCGLVLAGACSGGGEPGLEGFGDPQGTTQMCDEFLAPMVVLDTFPARHEGDLEGHDAAIEPATDACAEQDAPFGVEAAGPDAVVMLTDLAPGQTYHLQLHSTSDLGMYITTSCDQLSARAATGGCLAFIDSTVESPELGSFVAPDAGTVYVVVDYFLPTTPIDSDFEIEVYAEECSADNQCGSNHCMQSRCVECVSSFECGDPSHPVCDTERGICTSSDTMCVDDDVNDAPNDGPSGAVDLTPTNTNTKSATGRICDAPRDEMDFYSFYVAENGGNVTVSLDWKNSPESNHDLELTVYNDLGRPLAASLWNHPEQVDLTHLRAGTYYVTVDLWGAQDAPATVAYSIEIETFGVAKCETAAECAQTYDTQLFRGQCEAGACVAIVNNELETGATCDANSNCSSGLCSNFSFTANADTRSVCTASCATNDECSGSFGAGWVCTDYMANNMCVPRCQIDEECPVTVGAAPQGGDAWQHLTCDTGSGMCVPGA